MLIPLNLEELVGSEHLVRHFDEVINRIDTSVLEEQYLGGGTSAYHPVMLLKVTLYAYSQKIYSSRQIAKALRENIHFMWLSRMNQPDFRTVNRFRSVVLGSYKLKAVLLAFGLFFDNVKDLRIGSFDRVHCSLQFI